MEDKIKKAADCIANGEIARARRLLENVLISDSANIKALWMICRLHEARNDFDSWLHTLKSLEQLLPNEMAVIDELARAYAKFNRLPDSVSVYREFLKKNRDSSVARYNYAYYLGRAGEYKTAVVQYERLLDEDIETPEEVHLNLSKLLSERLNQYPISKDHLQKAIELNSGYAPAWFNLGNLSEQMGEIPKARECFDKVRELGDEDGGALARIADLTRFNEDPEPELVEAMEKKLHFNESPNPDLMFSLGRAYEQTGKYKESWYMFESANSIDRNYLPPYSQESMALFFERIKESYAKKTRPELTDSSLGQVFVCGNFRSGSTLLEQMLAAHSSFVAGGERGFFRKAARDPLVGFPETSKMGEELKAQLAERYNRETSEMFGLGGRVTDKRPDNLMLVGFIKKVLPEAKIIITDRNPMDVAWSIFSTRFGPDLPYATSMPDILHFIELQKSMAEHWSAVYEDDISFVSYEELVNEPKAILSGLLEKLGEEWEEGCLNFSNLKNFVTTASSAQVRRPLNLNAIGRSEPFHEYMNKSV